MKEYMTNNELIDYLSSKGVMIENKDIALQKIERYTYYSIVNSYKSIFKDKNGNYIDLEMLQHIQIDYIIIQVNSIFLLN